MRGPNIKYGIRLLKKFGQFRAEKNIFKTFYRIKSTYIHVKKKTIDERKDKESWKMEQNIFEKTEFLINEINDGKEEKFAELFEILHPGFIFIFNQRGIDERYQEDLLQECDFAISKQIHTIKDSKAGIAWANRIATNKTIDFLRKDKRFQKECVSLDNEEKEYADDKFDLPEDVMTNRETQQQIREIIFSLGERERMVIFCMYFNRQTIAEISEEMNINPNTVKTIHSRAKKQIKMKVEGIEKKTGVRLHSVSIFPILYLMLRENGWNVDLSVSANVKPSARTVEKNVASGISKKVVSKIAVAGVVAAVGGAGIFGINSALNRPTDADIQISEEQSATPKSENMQENKNTQLSELDDIIQNKRGESPVVFSANLPDGCKAEGDEYIFTGNVYLATVVKKEEWDNLKEGESISIQCGTEMKEIIKTGEKSADTTWSDEYAESFKIDSIGHINFDVEGYYVVLGQNPAGQFPYLCEVKENVEMRCAKNLEVESKVINEGVFPLEKFLQNASSLNVELIIEDNKIVELKNVYQE